MEDAVIVSAVRTPVGSFGGQFKDVPATQLGAHAVRAALERAGLSGDDVDEVVLGCTLQAGPWSEPCTPGCAGCGHPEGGARDDDQHGVRVGAQVGGDRVADDPRRRCRRGRRGRHGEHDARTVPGPRGAVRRAHEASGDDRLDGARRADGCHERHPYGRHRREPGGPVRHHPRGAGRVRRGQPAEGRAGRRQRPLQGGDRSHRGRRPQGHTADRGRRASPGRHDGRGARQVAHCVQAQQRGSRRRATRRVSTTVPRRSW